MGMIRVELGGSFSKYSPGSVAFSAMQHGHARAVADVIRWLSEDILPKAIKHDHQLHSEGVSPDEGFGK